VFSADLFANAVVSGLLLGGFYAAVAIGLAIVFGQLDIVNIAHPAFIIAGSYTAYIFNSTFGWDPVLVGVAAMPVFFAVGVGSTGCTTPRSSARGRSRCRDSRSSSASCSSSRCR